MSFPAAAALFLSAALVAPMPGGADGTRAAGSPQSQFQAALSHYQAGQYSIAAEELEDLARRLPPSFQVEELLGFVYSAEGKALQATHAFAAAARIRPQSAAAWANLAVSHARLGRNDLAAAEFERALRAQPNDYEANHDFGEFYARQGKIAQAIPYLGKAQALRPSAYGNGYDLGLAYEKTGQLQVARQVIVRLLKTRPTADLYNLLADVDEKLGNFVAAANEYQQAAHMDPTEQNIFDWGSEFLLHHTWNAAIEVFSKGLERYPNSAPLAVGLGLALYWRGEYEAAVKALMRATDLAPSDPHPYYFLSQAYQRAPDQATAVIARFRRFEELHPLDARAAYYYGMSLWKGKEMETAGPDLDRVEALLKKAERLDPSFTRAHLELGDLYSQEGQYAKAVPEYQAALRLNPHLMDAYYRLGQAYVHLGEKQLAEQEFKIHQQLYTRHLAEMDQERQQIRQFVYSTRKGEADPPVH